VPVALKLTEQGKDKIRKMAEATREAAVHYLPEGVKSIIQPAVSARSPSSKDEADIITAPGTSEGKRFEKLAEQTYVQLAVLKEEPQTKIEDNYVETSIGDVEKVSKQIGFAWETEYADREGKPTGKFAPMHSTLDPEAGNFWTMLLAA
jgi:hypothetical protein